MRRLHLVWMSLLLPVSAWAQAGDVDLTPPTPAMFTGPGAFGDGEYTGPRTPRPQARALRTARGGDGGCPTAPDGSDRRAGRLTVEDLRAVLPPDPAVAPIAYVCGSAGFADSATRLLEELGHPADRIRIERYGPSATA